MKTIWFGVLMAALVPAAALAQSAPPAWTRFVDPTENAFAFDVPQGWAVKGGVRRVSPLIAQVWLSAVSPDGATQFFIGDPSVPGFVLPKPNQAEGTTVPSLSPRLPPGVALGYRPGAEFAKYYGPKGLAAAGCTGAALTGAQALPDLARAQYDRATEMARGVTIRGGFTPPQQEAGIATFTCQSAGRPLAAGVAADTGQPNATIGTWTVSVIAGYLTAPGQEAWAQASLNRMLASRQFNPQWDEAMRQQLQNALTQQNQQADQAMALMQQQSQQFAAMMQAKGQSDQAALTASHNAFMNQMNQQSATRNAEFQNYQAQRSLNSWNFDAHIRNGNLYRDTDTGKIFEVDH
jgi:hypothetical protein